ncbi:MAG: hypothetical protein ABWY90_02160 [Solirubrobacterales bacterium]
MADREHSAVDAMQTPAPRPHLHRLAIQPPRGEPGGRHHAVAPCREFRDRPIALGYRLVSPGRRLMRVGVCGGHGG